jgi:hypothetical protein
MAYDCLFPVTISDTNHQAEYSGQQLFQELLKLQLPTVKTCSQDHEIALCFMQYAPSLRLSSHINN